MTSRSLKSLRITARNTTPVTTRAKSAFVSALLISLGCGDLAWAQNGWSPAPFVPSPNTRPLSESQAPANRLRNDASSSNGAAFAARWGKPQQGPITTQAATPASQIDYEASVQSRPIENSARFNSQPVIAASSNLRPITSGHQQMANRTADLFAPTPAAPRVTETKVANSVSMQPDVSIRRATNANVLRDENTPVVPRKTVAQTESAIDWTTLPTNNQPQARGSRFASSFEANQSQPAYAVQQVAHRSNSMRPSESEVITAANWTDRNSQAEPKTRSVLQKTQPESLFSEPGAFQPPATNPSTPSIEPPPSFQPPSSIQPPTELQPPSSLKPPSWVEPPPSLKEPSGDAAPRKLPPNPFPQKNDKDETELLPTKPPSQLRDKNSASDLEMPPSLREKSKEPMDKTPPKPSMSKKNPTNCDEVRDRATSANISSIDLDVAPNFGVSPKEKLTPEDKRRKFAESAAFRTWRDVDGNIVAEGKLIDHKNHLIIVENGGGAHQSIELRRLSDADAVYVFESWGLPVTCSLGNLGTQPRTYQGTTVAWKASGLCHKPLYFEEIQLERSGHEYGPIAQPAISTVHFFKNIAFLPYKMGIHPMNECQYSLGHYRPGNCAPWSIEPVPLSLRGAAAQAKAVTGAALMLP